MIMAHCFGSDQTAWRHLLPMFEQTHRIVLFDHVGHGGAHPDAFAPDQYPSADAFARDIINIIDELDLDRIDFVGHSVSCIAGMLASLERHARFRSLSLISASPRYLDDEETGYTGGFTKEDLNSLYESMNKRFDEWVDSFAELVVGNRDRPGLAAEFAATMSSLPVNAAVHLAHVIFESDYRSLPERIIHPTLILQPQNDPAVPLQVGFYLQRHIPDNTFAIIDAEGHLPHLASPREVGGPLRSFIASLP